MKNSFIAKGGKRQGTAGGEGEVMGMGLLVSLRASGSSVEVTTGSNKR